MRRNNTAEQVLKSTRFAQMRGLGLPGAPAAASDQSVFTDGLADGDCVVRDDPALIVVEVAVSGDRRDAARQAFRLPPGFPSAPNPRKTL